MSGAHAEFAPSGMYLTVACPGHHQLVAALIAAGHIPAEDDSEAAKEGEAGHEVAERSARREPIAEGDKASNGVEITEEMIDGGATWREALEGYPAKLEQPVQIARLHPTKCWGTPDGRQWNPQTKFVRLADYKFGHEYVDEFENWQLLPYAVGYLDELGVFDDPGVTIEMTVVQPRFYRAPPVRSWTIQTAGLKHYAERMKEAIRQAEAPNPITRSGPHCTYCRARAFCKTFALATAASFEFEQRAELTDGTPDQIGRELTVVQQHIKRLKARETGLEAVAEAMIKGGKRVPGYNLEQSIGRLAWTMPLDVVEQTAQMGGKSALKPPALITPTQAKDRKIIDAAVIGVYADRPKGAFKLVPTNTKTVRSKFG